MRGQVLVVHQVSPLLVVQWQRFGVAAGHGMAFEQPSPSAVAINQVVSGDKPWIEGTLHAEGQVWLTSPCGWAIGPQAQLQVGGLVCASLSLDTHYPTQDNEVCFALHGAPATVVCQGSVEVAPEGYVVLAGPHVRTRGHLTAPFGRVVVAAAGRMTLRFDAQKLQRVELIDGAAHARVRQQGSLSSPGGLAMLAVKGLPKHQYAVVQSTGHVQAQTTNYRMGGIVLQALGPDDHIDLSGVLDVSAPQGGNAGTIHTRAPRLYTRNHTQITLTAADGKTGKWVL